MDIKRFFFGVLWDLLRSPFTRDVAIPEDELEGYPECEHDVSVYEPCYRCASYGHSDEARRARPHHFCNYGSDRPPRTTEKFGKGEEVESYAERMKAFGGN